MSRHGWYFTLVSNGETAIEYIVVCCDDEFDRFVQKMRESWMELELHFGPPSRPRIELEFPNLALVKTLIGSSEAALDESIDNASGFWARLPLHPIQKLLHETGQLSRSEVLDFLRESEVSGSGARLCMKDPDHLYLTIEPGDSNDLVESPYLDRHMLPSHTNKS